MRAPTLPKLLKILLLISVVLLIASTCLMLNGMQLASKSPFLISSYFLLPAILFVLLSLALFIKSITTKSARWTMWVCLVVGGGIVVLGNLVVFTLYSISQEFGIVGIIFLNLSALLFILLPLTIKKKSWKIWLPSFHALLITVAAFMLLAHGVEQLSKLEVESRVTHINLGDLNDYVAEFVFLNNSQHINQYRVRKYAFFITKEPFLKGDPTERWKRVGEVEPDLIPDKIVEVDTTENIEDQEIVSDYSEVPPDLQAFNPDESIAYIRRIIDNDSLTKVNENFEVDVRVANYDEFKDAVSHFIPGQRIVLLTDIYLREHLVIEDIDSLFISGTITEEGNRNGFLNLDTTAVSVTFVGCDNLQIVRTGFVNNNVEPTLYQMCFKNCKNVSISNSYFMNNHQYSLVFDEASNIALLEGNLFEDYLASGVFYYAFQTHTIRNNEFLVGGVPDEYYNNYKIAKIDLPVVFNPSLNIENLSFVYHDNFWYPFGESFTHNDKVYKAYGGSMQHAVYAFGVYEVLAKELSLKYYGYKYDYVYSLLRAISGIHPFTFEMQDLKSIEFKHINPQFVNWATRFIEPGIVDEAFYESSIRRTSRMLIESYLYLKRNEDFPAILEDYSYMAELEDGTTFLKDRYHSTLNHYNDSERQKNEHYPSFNEPYHVSYIMGFWLRRMMDGSDESIWNACVKFMKIYDEQWLKEMEFYYQVRL